MAWANIKSLASHAAAYVAENPGKTFLTVGADFCSTPFDQVNAGRTQA